MILGIQKKKCYWFSGEVVEGDMKFVKGNKTLRESGIHRKTVLLFVANVKKDGSVKFLGEVTCGGYRTGKGKDKHKQLRSTIEFKLVPVKDRHVIHTT